MTEGKVKGWLVPYNVTFSVEHHWRQKFPDIRVKNGRDTAGDYGYTVPDGMVLVQTETDKSREFIERVVPNGKNVPIHWEDI
jgi:hypothetical protein